MIDTVELTGERFRVRPDNALNVQPAPVSAATGESHGGGFLFEQGGHPVSGVKAYWNDDATGAGMTIRRTPQGVPLACIHFSAPRVLHGLNVEPASLADTIDATERVESKLHEIGLEMDLRGGRLSRLDLTRNAELRRPFSDYRPVLESRPGGRRMNLRTYHGQGVTWLNTRREVCIYDKGLETRGKHKGFAVELTGGACLARAEARFKGADVLRDTLGADRLTMLDPDALRYAYTQQLETVLSAGANGRAFDTLSELIESCGGWTKGTRLFLASIGVEHLPPGFDSYLKQHAPTREELRRARRVIDEARAVAAGLETDESSWREMDAELRRVFLTA